MIKKIKKALHCKTNRELAKRLSEIAGKKIHPEQITLWDKRGFHKSTEALLELLLKEIKV